MKSCILKIAVMLLAATLSVRPVLADSPAHYAVCVGINQYSTSYIPRREWLSGCVSDARRVWTNITERGEWTPENAKILLDSAAKKTAIRSAITSAAANAVPGDVFLYYHASHGGNASSANDSLDVFLCSYNANYTDAELAADLAQFQSGVKVVVMVDACHSGGLFKSPSATRSVSASSVKTASATSTFDLAGRVGAAIDSIRAGEQRRRGAPRGIDSSEIGWLTAADYDQYSWDGRSGGAFTSAVIEGWNKGYCDDVFWGDADNWASFYELWNYAKDIAVGNGQPGTEDYTEAQCANMDVLRSTIAGWVGDQPPPAADDPPRLRAIDDIVVNVGEAAVANIRAFTDANAPARLSITSGDPSAVVMYGGLFLFSPSAAGDYPFTITAQNKNGAASTNFTVTAIIPTPGEPYFTEYGTNSLTICWEPVIGAEGYGLVVYDYNTGEEVFFDDVGYTSGVTVLGLDPNAEYICFVCAYAGDYLTDWSDGSVSAPLPMAPTWSDIPELTAQAGRLSIFDLSGFISGNPAPVLALTSGDGSLADSILSFTPSETGVCQFTLLASNSVGSATLLLEVQVGALAPKKFALCVGINEYLRISGLEGCVNDAWFMAANLYERGGWDGQDIFILTDSAATKSAIRTVITNFAAQAMAGDTFVYQHSSHGGQFNDTDGDDYPLYGEDGKDTFLCVYDEDIDDNTTAYNDYEIAEDLAAFPAGVKVAVIVDACHSAGLFRSRDAAMASAASFDIARRVSVLMDAGRARRRARGEDVARSISSSEIGWATAAEYYEYSMDGGFYHTDEWLRDNMYGEEYWIETNPYTHKGYYSYPLSYRMGGMFLASATWGWWNGTADTDAETGDNDGLCDVYEFWKKGYDFCSTVGDAWYGESDYNYYPQYTNVTVLRSIELGQSGSGPSSMAISFMLSGARDAGLAANITNAATYSEYLDWSTSVKGASDEAAGEKAVWASPYSWLSFALGSDTLMTNGLTSADVTIESFSPTGEGGSFALEVGISPVSIGSGGVDQAVLVSNLAKVLGIEGAATLDGAAFTSDGIGVVVEPPANGRARLVATPPADATSSFFMRALVK